MSFLKAKDDQRPTQAKMKPLVGYMAKLNCNTVLSMMCLSRDRPKTLAKINIRLGIDFKIGNKGMKQLCQTLKNSKGNKELVLNIKMCDNDQLRILAQYIRTSKHIKKLELKFKWNGHRINLGLTELLSKLKFVQGLCELDLEIQREFSTRQPKPAMKLRYLRKLQKLKISKDEHDSEQGNDINKLLEDLKGLEKLSEFSFDFSFCKGLKSEEIEEYFFRYLRGMKSLKYLTLDLTKDGSIEDKILDRLFMCISSIDNLISLCIRSGVCSPKMPEFLKRLQESLQKKPSFKSLNLIAARKCPSDLLIESLYMNKNESLKSLRVDFSESTLATDPLFMERVDISLRNMPSLQSLELHFPPRALGNDIYKDLGRGLQVLNGSLKHLTLSLARSFELSTEKIGYVTAGIKTLSNLENLYLNFSHCEISSEGMKLIAEGIDGIGNLKDLTLDFSSLIRRYLSLKQSFLSLFRKNVEKTGLEYFGQVFQRQKKLEYLALSLYGVRPTLEEFEVLASGIEGLKTLKSFLLWSDDTRKKDELFLGFRRLYQSLKTLPALNSLALKYETVDSEDLESLFLHLGGLKNLVTLDLKFVEGESMSFEAAEQFGEAMKNLKFLRNVTLKIFWKESIKEEIVDRWNDGLRNIEYLSTFVWRFYGLKKREQAVKLFERTKYIKVYSTFVRYRCISHFSIIPIERI